MGSLTKIAMLFAGALCLATLPEFARCEKKPQFIVEGDVYCEVCRLNFINRLSEPMQGAKLQLQCRGEEETNITYTLDGETNENGHYQLMVEGDHGDEECQVTLLKSSRPDCDELPDDGWAMKPSARITITNNSGFHDDIRHANPLPFLKKDPSPECPALFKELDISPSGQDLH